MGDERKASGFLPRAIEIRNQQVALWNQDLVSEAIAAYVETSRYPVKEQPGLSAPGIIGAVVFFEREPVNSLHVGHPEEGGRSSSLSLRRRAEPRKRDVDRERKAMQAWSELSGGLGGTQRLMGIRNNDSLGNSIVDGLTIGMDEVLEETETTFES